MSATNENPKYVAQKQGIDRAKSRQSGKSKTVAGAKSVVGGADGKADSLADLKKEVEMDDHQISDDEIQQRYHTNFQNVTTQFCNLK